MFDEIICTKCEKEIKGGEEFVAHLTNPKWNKLKSGLFPTLIVKTATMILCKSCSESK